MINLIYTILCIICLCMGFFVGLKMQTDKKIKLENPIMKIKEKIEDKQMQEELQEQIEEINKIANNIENYDGTDSGQEEVRNVKIGL